MFKVERCCGTTMKAYRTANISVFSITQWLWWITMTDNFIFSLLHVNGT